MVAVNRRGRVEEVSQDQVSRFLDEIVTALRDVLTADKVPGMFLKRVLERGERIWLPEQFAADFEVVAASEFQPPYVFVTRRSDGATGSLMYTTDPPVYFGWQEDDPDGGVCYG